MQPAYFINYCDVFIAILVKQKETLDTLRSVVTLEYQDRYKEESYFTEKLIEYLQVCMSIHTGHPEKYIEIQDRIGELIYDHSLLQQLDIEHLKN